jgi:hypothetical protein
MKMSKPGLCCDDCFALLAKTNTKAARLWMDLCEAQRRYGVFGLVTSDTTPSLLLLERMGFIITTDTRDLIVVKVRGEQDDQDGFFFCGGRCDD